MIYDAETNIISWEISNGTINHVREIGNFIIHVSKTEKPILLEILDASKFIKQFDKLKIKKNIKKAMAIN